MPRTNFDMLLEAGCHFGHLRRKWNPAMAPYIFMERNGIHIIDLHKTVVKIDEAAEALKQIAKSGKKILFVATKKQAKSIVEETYVKGYVDSLRAAGENVVLISGGDAFKGTPFASMTNGLDVATVMNMVGYEIFTLIWKITPGISPKSRRTTSEPG